jgi:membrane protein YdbS with pleckstrin-like domain
VARVPRDETVLLRLRPHWRVLVGAVVWAMLLAAIAGAAVAALERPWETVVVGAAALAWLGVGLRPTWRWWSTRWVLTERRLLIRHGLVVGSRVEIPLERIVDVGVSQTLGQRLLRSGTVALELPGTAHELRDVPDPARMQRILLDAMEDAPR